MTSKKEVLAEYTHFDSAKTPLSPEAWLDWLSDALDRYAYSVGMEAMGREYKVMCGPECSDDNCDRWENNGWNAHRTQAITKLKEITNQ